MANISGKATAITVVTPMKPWKSYVLRFLFRLITWGFFAEIQKRLIKLSFIHFAHWTIIRQSQFPQLSDSQPPDHPKYDYLFFVSNFNGSWDQYIDAFSEVIPLGIDNIWNLSEGFPGAVPESAFFRYIKHNQFSSAYYYNATPGSAATEVTSALTLSAELNKFQQSSQGLTPVQFAEAYQKFLIVVQNHLGETGLANWDENEVNPPATVVAGGV